jgi:hypothetical protein
MPELPSDLATIQRWMQNVVVHPHGVVAGLHSDAARQEIDVDETTLDDVIAPSQALTSVERLSIYSHAYTARLLECLRAAYPTLLHALGQDAFDAFAIGYLQAYPSQSYTLDKLGARFAQFLEETRPDRTQCEDQTSAGEVGWPDFLIDLARFDWTVGEVFDGPGSEDQTLLTAAQVAAISPDRRAYARLVPAPSLRLLAFRYPVNAYFSAVRSREDSPPPGAAESYLALTRRDFVVCRHVLSAPQFAILSAIVSGVTVGGAVEHVAATVDRTDAEQFAADLRDWFRYWTAHEFFAAIA